jgi:hypothetical protein
MVEGLLIAGALLLLAGLLATSWMRASHEEAGVEMSGRRRRWQRAGLIVDDGQDDLIRRIRD